MGKDKPSRARRTSRLNRRRTLRSKNDEIAAAIPRAFPRAGEKILALFFCFFRNVETRRGIDNILLLSPAEHLVTGILESFAVVSFRGEQLL